jgi:hypothetical protein
VSIPKGAREYLASIGSKGGKAKGKRKARSPEHYAKMVEARKARRMVFVAGEEAPGWCRNCGAHRSLHRSGDGSSAGSPEYCRTADSGRAGK